MSVSRRGLRMPSHLAEQLKPGSVKAGILSHSIYPADTLTNARTGEQVPDPRAGMPVAVIAAALEYGTGQNHPRPFMQQTVIKHRKEWSEGLVRALKNGLSAEDALRAVGQAMRDDIHDVATDWPADNSDSWAAFKGFNRGLDFTGTLIRSIESEVEGG